jgi:glycosyltransferase involved in cell wall biosynthesis
MRPAGDFPSPTLWSSYRQIYYYRRDRVFLEWVKNSPGCRAVHFQEYTYWLAPLHFPMLKRAGVRLFFTVHAVYPHRYMSGVPKAVFHKWCRDGWKQCDALFVHTEGLGRILRQFLRSEHPPILVTPSGITETPALSLSPFDADQVVDPRHLLFFGVIRPTKGLHVLLQAMHELRDCRLTIAGDFKEASYKKKILECIAQLPKDRVRLIDRFVDDTEIPGLFAQSGLVILPYTFFYGQSGVLRLAMKYGVPVVASEVGGSGESVRAWRVGESVPPCDPEALARAIRRVAEPQRYRAAKAAVERVRGDLTWARTAQLTWQAYGSILDP